MPDYDDGLVTAVAKALAEVPIHSTSRLYLDRSDANDAARAAIAAVLEWQGRQEPQSVQLAGTMFRDGDMEHLWILPNGEIVVTKDSDPP